MKFVLRYMSAYKKESILAPLFKMLEAVFELLVPFVVAAIIDKGIEYGDVDYILRMAFLMIGLALIGVTSALMAQYFAAKTATGVSMALRKDLDETILNMDKSRYRKIGKSTLLTRMTSDVLKLQNAINMFLRLFLRSPFIVIGAFIMSVIIDGSMSLIIGGIIVVLAIVVYMVMRITLPRINNVQEKFDELNVKIKQNYSGAKVVRGFVIQNHEKKSFSEHLNRIYANQIHVGRLSNILNPLTFALVNFGVILILYFGGKKVDTGSLSNGEVVALLNYMSQVLVELVKLANLIVLIMNGIPSARRLEEVIDHTEDVAVDDAPIVVSTREIVEKELSKINKGEKVGVIGPTGSGKSLLLSLYMENVTDKAKVGYVPQEDNFFSGTIAENILLKEYANEDLDYSLNMSCFQEVVDIKGGVNEKLNKNAGNLSTGQKKRLALTRAINKKPDLLLMDDVTNPLDMITEKQVLDNVLQSDMSVVIATQKPSAVMRSDRIIVIDNGKLLDVGTHNELLERCPLYSRMYYAQFPERSSYA